MISRLIICATVLDYFLFHLYIHIFYTYDTKFLVIQTSSVCIENLYVSLPHVLYIKSNPYQFFRTLNIKFREYRFNLVSYRAIKDVMISCDRKTMVRHYPLTLCSGLSISLFFSIASLYVISWNEIRKINLWYNL